MSLSIMLLKLIWVMRKWLYLYLYSI